ncbi:glycosyltransferase family 4 protein [Candidatus Gottesmanbacteria bacterium]|nr:glycosyltransferase family 4 protein [Candidatus Gottesmanbacteria bacterium]
MKIGIDARLIEETGVGRYIRNLIEQLGELDKRNSYVCFLPKHAFGPFHLANNRWEKRLADVPWHSVSEQIMMPLILLREKLDLVHIPYFNIPILYPGKIVVTIHDLTILHFHTGRATTLPKFLYQMRRFGYWLVHRIGLPRAKSIVAVSNATKQEIIDHFRIDAEKIRVTYEGVDSKIYKSANDKSTNKKPIVPEPYFLYVGNAYPHKNLETLVQAFQPKDTRLVLVGKDDYFYQRLKKEVGQLGLRHGVIFFGQANDAELANLYSHAIALVFPSMMEGFGLPGLEALANGCQVIASDIPVFHEIFGKSVSYVDPYRAESLLEKLTQAERGALPKPAPREVDFLLEQFSWETMAKKTLDVYEGTARRL